MNENTMERKLRRTLNKAGYALHRSRRKVLSYHDQGGYMIVDTSINGVAAGPNYDLSLEGVAEWAKHLV